MWYGWGILFAGRSGCEKHMVSCEYRAVMADYNFVKLAGVAGVSCSVKKTVMVRFVFAQGI